MCLTRPGGRCDKRRVESGMLLGLVWLAFVLATALALGRKAAAGVKAFREEEHESFPRRKP